MRKIVNYTVRPFIYAAWAFLTYQQATGSGAYKWLDKHKNPR